MIGFVVAGLIIGALARLLMPGRQKIGLLWTLLLGLAGSVIGGSIANLIGTGDIASGSAARKRANAARPSYSMVPSLLELCFARNGAVSDRASRRLLWTVTSRPGWLLTRACFCSSAAVTGA